MKKREFKQELFNLFNASVDELNNFEKIDYIKEVLIAYQKENERLFDTSNKGKSWTDEELFIILSDAPTAENCAKYALLFKRGYGSIEQIYRWAATSSKEIDKKGRKDDAFIKQIKRVAKKIGFRA